jgi:hypothetical protein
MESVLLLAEGAAFDESRLAAGGLAQHCVASDAHHDRLGMTEDGGDLIAAGAFHVHEVGVGLLHETLQLVTAAFLFRLRVEKVNC